MKLAIEIISAWAAIDVLLIWAWARWTSADRKAEVE